MLGYGNQLGMGAIGGNTITHLKTFNARTNCHNRTDIAVPEGILIELLRTASKAVKAIGAGLLIYLLHFVWLLTGLINPAGLAEINEHALGTADTSEQEVRINSCPRPTTGVGTSGRSGNRWKVTGKVVSLMNQEQSDMYRRNSRDREHQQIEESKSFSDGWGY